MKVGNEHLDATLTKFLGSVLLGLFFSTGLHAGPPFNTDDPEPVDFHHWEIDLASMLNHDSSGWSGTLPHVEINYGALPNLHLHIITPLAFVTSRSGPSYYGYGDTELGVKYRFIKQGNYTPDVGVFPTMEVPTGNESRGLGAGHVQFYFPIWLQKDFGKWTTYGGGGFWLNPGVNNKDWGFVGWLLQRQITDHFALGAEVFHETPKVIGGESNTFINGGGILDLSDTTHILISVGHSVQGPRSYIGYFALQFTFGPRENGKK